MLCYSEGKVTLSCVQVFFPEEFGPYVKTAVFLCSSRKSCKQFAQIRIDRMTGDLFLAYAKTFNFYHQNHQILSRFKLLLHRQLLQSVNRFLLHLKFLRQRRNRLQTKINRSCQPCLPWCVRGTGHVMVRFNLKSETIGRPFEVSRLSKPVPSTNYGKKEKRQRMLLGQDAWYL